MIVDSNHIYLILIFITNLEISRKKFLDNLFSQFENIYVKLKRKIPERTSAVGSATRPAPASSPTIISAATAHPMPVSERRAAFALSAISLEV